MTTPTRPPLYPVGYLAVLERSVNTDNELVFEDRVEVARIDEVSWNSTLETYDYITTVNPGTPDEFRNRCLEDSLRPPFVEQAVLDKMADQSREFLAYADSKGDAAFHGRAYATAMRSLIKSYEHVLKEREMLRDAIKHHIKFAEKHADDGVAVLRAK